MGDALIRIVFVGLIAVVFVFAVGYWISPEPGSFEENIFVKIVDTVADIVNPFRTTTPTNEYIKEYDLGLSSNDLEYFDWAGKTATEIGYLTDETTNWRTVVLTYEGEKYEVEMALRGDKAEHWNKEKKSFKIKAGEDLFGETKRHNFIILEDRVYFGTMYAEWLVKRLGLIASHTEIAMVRINGKGQGLYLVEEGWDKYLLRKEGQAQKVIIKYTDEWLKTYKENPASRREQELEIKNVERIEGDTDGEIRSRMAVMMQLVKIGSYVNFEEYFDTEEIAKVEAFRVLYGQYHDFRSDNLRWYYDRETKKFSFVARSEGEIIKLKDCNAAESVLLAYFASNPKIIERRNFYLSGLLEDEAELMEYYQELEDKYFNVILLDATMVRRSNKAAYYMRLNRRHLEYNIALLKECLQ